MKNGEGMEKNGEEKNDINFFASAIHNLKNPLHGIAGYTHLLKNTRLNEQQLSMITGISNCCTQLVSIVNDILDLSKIMSGTFSIETECFVVKELLDDVLGIFQNKNIRVVISNDVPKSIIADKQKIIQVLVNLVSNAIKYGDNKNVILNVEKVINEKCLEFSVEDFGIGISEKDKEKLFSAFFQVSKGKKTDSGHGLGLFICKKIVNLLGGEIKVESEEGNGSVFYFTVKYEPVNVYKEFIEKELELYKSVYILILNENVNERIVLGDIFYDCGMIPIVCSSSKEVSNLIKRYEFKACITTPSLASQLNIDFPIVLTTSVDRISVLNMFIKNVKVDGGEVLGAFSDPSGAFSDPSGAFSDLSGGIEDKNQDRKQRILLVEDNIYNIDMTEKMLQSIGFKNVDTAENGQVAIKLLSEKQYDIVLLDLKMPIVNGIQVIEYIRGIKRDKKQTRDKNENGTEIKSAPEGSASPPKIIVLTASILMSDREICKKYNVSGFLTKPLNMNHLKNLLYKL
jgi:two-component system, sensor histidine kinase and response regulator